MCTSQPFWKISHSPPVGLALRFVPWFINQTPKEGVWATDCTKQRFIAPCLGRKVQSPWNTSAPVLAISLLWVAYSACFPSSCFTSLFCACRVPAVCWAAHRTCSLTIHSNLNWVPGSSGEAVALPASYRPVLAGSVGSFFPTFSGMSKSHPHSQNTLSSTPHTWLITIL